MANLFLDGIFSSVSNSPSTVRIDIPSFTEGERTILKGLIIGDPSFSAQNKWGNVISDISSLTDFSILGGNDSLFSWISASTMCWKGTSPLNLQFEFYLINYAQGLNNKESLRELVKLASLSEDIESSIGGAKVKVHGGYAADVLSGNVSYLDNLQLAYSDNIKERYTSDLKRGTAAVAFGNKMQIKHLLLNRVDVTESTVEVADQGGYYSEPLYYKVGVSFTGIKPLVTKDVDYMFR